MKNLTSYFLFFFVLLLASNLKAQTVAQSSNQASSTNLTTSNEVKILTHFKATKRQKKLIRKVKKYVGVHFLGRNKQTKGLVGKTVKVQLNIGTDGTIETITVMEGQNPSIDNRVVDLVKKYDEQKPISASKIEKPAVIQLVIPLVGKQYTL